MCREGDFPEQIFFGPWSRGPGIRAGGALSGRRIASKNRGTVGGASRSPRRRPRRGGKPRLKNGFPRVSADPWSNGGGECGPRRARGRHNMHQAMPFECANLPRGRIRGGGAPAMVQRVAMAGDSFQMGTFSFRLARFDKMLERKNDDKNSAKRR